MMEMAYHIEHILARGFSQNVHKKRQKRASIHQPAPTPTLEINRDTVEDGGGDDAYVEHPYWTIALDTEGSSKYIYIYIYINIYIYAYITTHI